MSGNRFALHVPFRKMGPYRFLPGLSDALQSHLLTVKEDELKYGWSEVPSWLFVTKAGTPLDPANVRRAMLRILKAAKLPEHFTPHCLRHTYASILLSEGISPVYVQEQLGHATIELTVSTYGRWLKKKAPGTLDRLDSMAEVASGSKVVAKVDLVARRPSLRKSKGRIFKHLRWSRRPGLNGRPAVYETAALPTELRRLM